MFVISQSVCSWKAYPKGEHLKGASLK